MKKTTRRSFLKTAALVGGAAGSYGFFIAEGTAQETTRPNVACIGIGGRGGEDSNYAADNGNIVAICDPDRGRLEGRARDGRFQKAKKYTDFRKMLEENAKDIDVVTISAPDHVHAPATLMAMRMGKHCFTQKPLTRTIYEARKLAEVAKETGVCTQMGNQGTVLDRSRTAIDLMKAGIIGTIKEVIVWSNRPVWPQKPYRATTMKGFEEETYTILFEDGETPEARKMAEDIIKAKQKEIDDQLQNLDWKNWLGVAKYREYFPGMYHPFAHRAWWDFGTGALGDMACHMLTVPYVAAGLKDPTWVRAKTTGHDFDSFPEASIIEFEFPANEERGKIPFWWYDREGNRPPREIFAEYGIGVEGAQGLQRRINRMGVLIIGENGAMYSTDDYCENREFYLKGGERINEDEAQWKEVRDKTKVFDPASATDGRNFNPRHAQEFFKAVIANDPSIARSNFIDLAGPLTETILLGNLAVWAAPAGGEDGAIGDWGEKVEWDAKNLKVTNLSSLKTPGVADIVKPVYSEGYRLD